MPRKRSRTITGAATQVSDVLDRQTVYAGMHATTKRERQRVDRILSDPKRAEKLNATDRRRLRALEKTADKLVADKRLYSAYTRSDKPAEMLKPLTGKRMLTPYEKRDIISALIDSLPKDERQRANLPDFNYKNFVSQYFNPEQLQAWGW